MIKHTKKNKNKRQLKSFLKNIPISFKQIHFLIRNNVHKFTMKTYRKWKVFYRNRDIKHRFCDIGTLQTHPMKRNFLDMCFTICSSIVSQDKTA
jgi:hypothetical protein